MAGWMSTFGRSAEIRKILKLRASGRGERRLGRKRGQSAGAQQRRAAPRACQSPVMIRQTDHSAPFAPGGDATRTIRRVDREREAELG
jgi:hypothetical protein